VQREQQQRRRPEAVPVEVAAGKEKGKDKELTLVLTRDYYEQVDRKNSQAALHLSLDWCCMSQRSIAHAGAPALNAYGVKLVMSRCLFAKLFVQLPAIAISMFYSWLCCTHACTLTMCRLFQLSKCCSSLLSLFPAVYAPALSVAFRPACLLPLPPSTTCRAATSTTRCACRQRQRASPTAGLTAAPGRS
jgi:hypothetical protein